jgi:DNA-binding transcriptional MerR regulator
MNEVFHIGEVANRSGVSVDTVRFYERRHLLPVAPRKASGYRVFTVAAIERVRFIKLAQELGFTLDEIGTLLSVNGGNECVRVHDLLVKKLTELDARMASMQYFRKLLTHYLAECEAELKKHPNSSDCPVLVEIAGK